MTDVLGTEAVYDFFIALASSFPISSGIAGYSFLYTIGYTTMAREHVRHLAKQFIGFDTGYTSMQLVMAQHTPPPSWLTFLGKDILSMLGGHENLTSHLGSKVVSEVGSQCVVLRSACHPPVGDITLGAKDLGLIPEVARILKRVQISDPDHAGLGTEDDGLKWLYRFNTMEPTHWENGIP